MMCTRKEERREEISERMKAKRNLENKILAMRRKLNDVYKERVKDANCGGGTVIARGKGLNLYMSNVLPSTMFPMVNVRRAARGSCRGGPGLRGGRSFRGGIIVPLSCPCPCQHAALPLLPLPMFSTCANHPLPRDFSIYLPPVLRSPIPEVFQI